MNQAKTLASIKKIKKISKWTPRLILKKGIDNMKKKYSLLERCSLWTKTKIKIATKDWFKIFKR